MNLCCHTSSNCKHFPHSFNVIRWSSSGSHDSKNGSMQCSNVTSGARIGKSSWRDTERSCGCPSKSHHFQTAAFAQRRVIFDSASISSSLYLFGNSSRCDKSRITLKSHSRIRRGKSAISSSVHDWKECSRLKIDKRIDLDAMTHWHFFTFSVVVDVCVFHLLWNAFCVVHVTQTTLTVQFAVGIPCFVLVWANHSSWIVLFWTVWNTNAWCFAWTFGLADTTGTAVNCLAWINWNSMFSSIIF